MPHNDFDLKSIIKGVLPNIIVMIVIVSLSLVIPRHDIIGFLLIVLVAVLSYKLYDEVFRKVRPNGLNWLKAVVLTLVFTSVVFYLYYWLKGYGLLGLAGLVFLFASYRVYKGRKLFLKTAKYIGGKLK